MTRAREEVARELRAGDGLLVLRERPELARTAQRWAATGGLGMVLPGVYADPERVAEPDLRIRALARWEPDAVLTGEAAAYWTFWPQRRPRTVTATYRHAREVPPGFALARGSVPAELVAQVRGVRVTTPALTALDLAVDGSGAGIDQALLTRACSLAEMHEALRLTPRRPGNAQRRALLHDSRDEPWSEAERLAHALLRQAGITGWRDNVPVLCGERRYDVDLAFPAVRLAVEVDGYAVHGQPEQFHRDRQKWSDLTAYGWRVLHLTWPQLVDDPAWVVATIRATLAGLASLAS